ncbi:MAG: hypothetical protein L6Q99_07550 [Planctomycetes bacterium]|nr:hypothetical protein [Planctomycetota bacterium]
MITDEEIERALGELEARLLEDPSSERERTKARREFFGDDSTRDELAERRFREWFLLERPTDAWQTPPIRELAQDLVSRGQLDADALGALANSFCGVFTVTSVVAGEGVWLRDLSSGGEHPLIEREGSAALEPGDVLIGRLFVFGPTANRISRAAAVFREPKLQRALERDLEAARARRRGVPRLSQLDLERMFWPKSVTPTGASAVETARVWLAASGVPREAIDGVFAELATMPPDENRWTFGAHDALGAVLDRLAFETDVDLEAARRLLLAAWLELSERESAPGQPVPTEAEERDVKAALAAFDRGRAEGRDLERLFAELERDLGLDADDEDPEDVAPDFPGVVGAVVEEFLWETEREHGAEVARAFESIRHLAAFGQSIGVFENLGPRELLTYATVWLPERGELVDAAAARQALVALRAFCDWAAERQGLDVDEDFRVRLGALEESLPRIATANRFVEPGVVDRGELCEVKSISDTGIVELTTRAGLLRNAAPRPELATHLQSGDRVRALLERDGGVRVLRCFPRECAAVLERD